MKVEQLDNGWRISWVGAHKKSLTIAFEARDKNKLLFTGSFSTTGSGSRTHTDTYIKAVRIRRRVSGEDWSEWSEWVQ